MNTPDPNIPPNLSPKKAADEIASAAHSAMDTARDKLASATETAKDKLTSAAETAREKLEAARDTTRDALHTAREKVEGAGTSLLQWTRDNPATALAAVFASGLMIGCAFALSRHEKTFGERLSEDPVETLRDAVYSALAPIGDRIHSAADSARSAAGRVADSISHARNGQSWTSRLRDVGDNLKFW